METTIRALRKQQNSVSLTARLPPELLASIFKWDAIMEREKSRRTTSWIRLSHVCADWRRIALDCPDLWCYYTNNNLNWLNTLVSRSGTVPFHVLTDLHRIRSKGLRQSLGEIHRIQELCFCAYYRKHWDKISKVLSKLEHAPFLEVFRPSFNLVVGGGVQALPDYLFNGEAPRLTDLELDGCLIGNNSFLLANLTTLTLRHLREENNGLSLPQLFVMLNQAPNLETLELKDACISNGLDDIPPPRAEEGRIRLPRLQHITISRMCATILSHISHHNVAQIFLDKSNETNTSIQALCATLATRIQPVSRARMENCYGSSYTCDFDWEQTPTLMNSRPGMPHARLKMRIPSGRREDFFATLRDIWKTLPMTNLRVLNIDDVNASKEFWLALVGDLKFLTTICVKNGLTTLLQALRKKRGHFAASFKSLHNLFIREWTFDSTMIDSLGKCLRARRRCGAKLSRLIIQKGKYRGPDSFEVAARLRSVAQEVIWDVETIADKSTEGVGANIRQCAGSQHGSRSSSEVERWDYSSPEENYPYRLSADSEDF
ncbi:hypothetical protein DXG01_015280 [Tephrocybe rancida]|nr:hypothetical protein DXG01_015280 [Tephrocybe rancida]